MSKRIERKSALALRRIVAEPFCDKSVRAFVNGDTNKQKCKHAENRDNKRLKRLNASEKIDKIK